MMRRLLISLLAVIAVVVTDAATTYYVDLNATGANNGTSWANAWTHLSNSVGNVSPGDTVEISKGTYPGLTQINLTAGTAGNLITYRISQDPAHNGLVVMSNALSGPFTLISGALDTNFASTIGYNTYLVPTITNNCGWFIYRDDTNAIAENEFQNIFVGNGMIVEWLALKNTVRENPDTDNYIFGVNSTYTSPYEIRYCWTYGGTYVFSALYFDGSGYGAYVHHCLIENLADNVVGSNGNGEDFGWNVIRNKFRGPSGLTHTEADTFQANYGPIQNVRIHHNVIEPCDHLLTSIGGSDLSTNFFFYRNVIRPDLPTNAPTDDISIGHIQLEAVPPEPEGIWSNWWFANNTFIVATNGMFSVMAWIQRLDKPQVSMASTNGMFIVNNLTADYLSASRGGFVAQFSLYDGTADSAYIYSSNNVMFDYNVYASPTNAAAFVRWATTTNTSIFLTNAIDIQNETGWSHNQSWASVNLVNPTNYDYRPKDTSLMIGTNLTSFTNVMPFLDQDIYGNKASGTWEVGAASYQSYNPTDGLLLWLQFDEPARWTNGGYIPDHSGLGHHAQIIDPPEWSATYGGHYTPDIAYADTPDGDGHYYLPPLAASLNAHLAPIPTNGPGVLNAAQFLVTYRGLDPHGGAQPHAFGTFAAVTNIEDMAEMTNGTWSAWVMHQQAPWLVLPQQTAIMDCGTLENQWSFRSPPGETWKGFLVFTNGTDNGSQFNAVHFSEPSSNVWYHYCVTWDGTNFIGYSNAVAISTNVSPVSSIITTNSFGGSYSWIAVGIQTHSSPPDPVGGGYPNNGAFIGQMADLRIYNRALTSDEVATLYQYAGVSDIYYVSPTGDNSNTGLTADSPWTMAKGLTNLAPDVTVIALDGNYPGPVIVDRIVGTAGHPWTLQSLNKWGAIVTNSASQGIRIDSDAGTQTQYGIIDGFWVTNAVNNAIAMGGNMIVRNCKATGGAATTESLYTMFPITNGGVFITGGVIEDCIAENAGQTLHHGFYYAGGMTVRRCISRNNSGFGFHNYTGSDSYTNTGCITENCLSYGNTSKYGIAAWNADGDDGSRPGTNYFYNCTLLDGIEVAYGAARITNCIILNSPQDTSNAIHHSPGRTCTVTADYNMSTNSLAPDAGAHDVTGDPLFVGGGDYRLTSGSGAISAAADLSSLFTTDLLGTTRPQGGGWDIGAYEFIAAPAGGGSGEMHVSGSVRARSISTP